jgi:Ni/Fe-hydrogenase subunit HybB-like protein
MTVAKLSAHLKDQKWFYVWIVFLLGVLGVAGVAAFLVWTRGLSVTGLSDRVPWGLWITTDLSAVALGSGSFVTAALVYFMGQKRFASVSRVALLIGLLADTGTTLTLLLDLGRPDRFYHPVIYWNPKSLLWVITWSIILYIGVLLVELAPVLTESRWLARWPIAKQVGERIHHATPVVALLGIVISTIHLAATGAAYGIVRGRVVWFNPAMSIFFFTSGIFAGLSFTILTIVVTSRVVGRDLIDRSVLDEMAQITAWVIVACGIVRMLNMASNYFSYKPFLGESVNVLYTSTPYSLAVTLGEFLFGMIIPLSIYFNPNLRSRFRNLVIAGLSTTMGLLLCRWDVTLSGLVATLSYSPSNPTVQLFEYLPTWVEWAGVAGVLAYAALAYTLAVRFLPIFEEEETDTVEDSPEPATVPIAAT